MNRSLLLNKEDISDPAKVPAWVIAEYESFSHKVSNDDFPCHFGTIAEKQQELRYTYSGHSDWSALPDTLDTFMELSRAHPKVRHALIGFFEPEQHDESFAYYQQRFWDVCNFLHRHDPKPWPSHVPTDTADPLWEFCFGGDALFLFVGFPAYRQRKSRHFGQGMMILYQPKRVFNGIEGATPGGIRARRLIRPRLQKMDGGMEMHPDFNIIDEKLAYRWKQYCASDDNSPAVGECPFHSVDSPVDERVSHDRDRIPAGLAGKTEPSL